MKIKKNKNKEVKKMRGIIKKFELRTCETKDKKNKFKLLEFVVDVKINDKGDIKTLKGSYGEEYARKYFAFCGVKTKDLIGKEVEVSLAKREYEKEGERRTINYIKYMNVLDENGEAIYMPKDDEEGVDF